MTLYFRKNYGFGTTRQAISKNIADGYLYYNIFVETKKNSLPNGSDGSLYNPSNLTDPDLTSQFKLVIWSTTVDPGDATDFEIVIARRTENANVYDIITRGDEDTAIVAHPAGSYVGLHYTAGLSMADLEPIRTILAAPKGSLIYTGDDGFGNKIIDILTPSTYGKVLVTAGDNKPPFWDWVWESPGALSGMDVTILVNICSFFNSIVPDVTIESPILATSLISTGYWYEGNLDGNLIEEFMPDTDYETGTTQAISAIPLSQVITMLEVETAGDASIEAAISAPFDVTIVSI